MESIISTEPPNPSAVSHSWRSARYGAMTGMSDHGANKSLYATDPDGLEFEVMWLVPSEHWGDEENVAIVRPLVLADEHDRFDAIDTEGANG